jgi:hypothetical protein
MTDDIDPFEGRKTKLFISHKAGAKETAKKIYDIIDSSSKNIGIWTSALIDKGVKWRPAIIKALEEATDLVLLFTDRSENWDWCLYETGFFDALVSHRGDTRGVVVIHHKDVSVPDPLSANQTVPARIEDLEEWLGKLFRNETDEYKKKARHAAVEICSLFQNLRQNLYDTDKITIVVPTFPDLLKLPEDTLPHNTIFTGPKDFFLDVARHVGEEITWPVLKQKLSHDPHSGLANSVWLSEISRTLHRLASRDAPALQSVLLSDTRRYRAVLDQAYTTPAGSLECILLLVEDVGGPTIGLDEGATALLASLRMAIRLRLEVVCYYDTELDRLLLQPGTLRIGLSTALHNIFTEAEFRFLYRGENLNEAFDPRARITLGQLTQRFQAARNSIESVIEYDAASDASLNAPFEAGAISILRAALAEIRTINREYLNMAAARVPEIIRTLSGGDNELAVPDRPSENLPTAQAHEAAL